jgi:hypothetical protein
MEALVKVGTVPPRAVRVSVASSIVRSVGDKVETVQCVGYSRHMLATQYCLMPGVMPMEITFIDMEDKYKKYGTL